MHCLKSEMSIQPRYDASFLAVNDELTITIMQKWTIWISDTRLRGHMERGQGHNTNEAEASCSEAEAEARFSGLEAEALTRT